MQEHEFELSVGDVLQIGDEIVTIIDIDGSEVSFRVDSAESANIALSSDSAHDKTIRPR